METLQAKNFNLKSTIESGQLFRYSSGSDGSYRVVAGDSIVNLRQEGDKLEFESSNDFDVESFLGLRHSYSGIVKSIRKDEKIAAAIKSHHGLRILEQGLWECTASFICSSFSNIPRIRRCIENIATAFGEPIGFEGLSAFSFPQPHQISSFQRLEKCGLGYRAKYLFETAMIFASGSGEFSQRNLRSLSYADAKEKFMELPGVGSKVADCILLFSCGFYEAFPVDVWVKRAMLGSYGMEINAFAAGRKPNERIIAGFARSYFGKYAGYAQQFIYHNSRTSGKLPSALVT